MEGARASQGFKRKRPSTAFRKGKRGKLSSVRRIANSTHGVHVFKRTFSYVTAGSATLDTNASTVGIDMSVNLEQFPNYVELSQLFDEYRIVEVKWSFMPSQINAEVLGTGALTVLPPQISTLATVEERTDGTPISLSAMMNYQSFQSVMLDKKRSRTFKHPAIATQLYQTVTSTGYAPKTKQWINATDTLVPHYCGKGLLSNKASSATCTVSYTIYVSAIIECRNSR